MLNLLNQHFVSKHAESDRPIRSHETVRIQYSTTRRILGWWFPLIVLPPNLSAIRLSVCLQMHGSLTCECVVISMSNVISLSNVQGIKTNRVAESSSVVDCFTCVSDFLPTWSIEYPFNWPAFSRGRQLVSFRFEYRLPVPEHRS